jgi:hypothetical protein
MHMMSFEAQLCPRRTVHRLSERAFCPIRMQMAGSRVRRISIIE